MTLLNLQRLFKADLQRTTALSISAIRAGRFSAARRLDVYQYAVMSRMVEAVMEDFPLVSEQLGEAVMHDTIGKFLARYPSRYASLCEVSAGLANFLAESGDLALSELARFEWSKILSENAGPTPECRPFFEMTEADFDSAKLIFDSSIILFKSDWHVTGGLRLEKTYLLIRRKGGHIVAESVDQELFTVLQAMASGSTPAQSVEKMSAATPEIVEAMFFRLVRGGVIVGFRSGAQ